MKPRGPQFGWLRSLFWHRFALPHWRMPSHGRFQGPLNQLRGSLRLQLVFWNIVAITLFLAVLGLVCHFAVYRYMLQTVDNELMHRMGRFQHPKGFRIHGFDPRHEDVREDGNPTIHGDRKSDNNNHNNPGPGEDRPPVRPFGYNWPAIGMDGGSRWRQPDRRPENRVRPHVGQPPAREDPPNPPNGEVPEGGDRQWHVGGQNDSGQNSGGQNDGPNGPPNGPMNDPNDPNDPNNPNSPNDRGQTGWRSGGRNDDPPGEGPRMGHDPYEPRLFFSIVKAEMHAEAIMPWDSDAVTDVLQHPQTIYSVVTAKGEDLRVLTTSGLSLHDQRGAVQTAYPLKEVYRAMAGLDMALLCLIPVGLVGAWGMGTALTARVLRPVHMMTQSAGILGAEDLTRRLPVSGNDEFSELATTFNGLLGRLDSAFQEQRQLLLLQQRFTADASHELKTPLTIIKGRASLSLARVTTDEKSRKAFEEIDAAANSMSRLVQDLLLLARSDEGRLGHNRISLSVQGLIDMAVARSVRPDGPQIRVDTIAEDLEVVGNEDELVRLLRNLLDNAVQYTPAQGSISVSARSVVHSSPSATGLYGSHIANKGNSGEGQDVAGIEIIVQDTGQGIAPEHLPHLGERFYRVDSSRTRPTGGTGLGLSICRGIVTAHGGTMSFESQPGQGTRVTLTFPGGIGRL